MQTKLRTYDIVPNNNISFPIGTSLTVEKLYDLRDIPTVFGKHKKQGIDINKLLKALVSYKLTDNFSIKKSISNSTVTVDSWKRTTKNYIYANFDAMNTPVLRHK